MAIGLQTQVRDVWFLFGAVAVHELAIIFCLGLEMLASRIRIRIYVLYMVLLSLVTPLGVAVGVAITEYADADRSPAHALVVAVLRAVATGTLLYVIAAFFFCFSSSAGRLVTGAIFSFQPCPVRSRSFLSFLTVGPFKGPFLLFLSHLILVFHISISFFCAILVSSQVQFGLALLKLVPIFFCTWFLRFLFLQVSQVLVYFKCCFFHF